MVQAVFLWVYSIDSVGISSVIKSVHGKDDYRFTYAWLLTHVRRNLSR